LINERAPSRHDGNMMTSNRPPDPVPEIVASGREITRDDVEMLWADLINGCYTWQETSQRALALIETVNVDEHIVNWGLMDLYYLWQPGTARDAESQRAKREAWRARLREYDADPDGWNRAYYRDMLVEHAGQFGYDKARSIGRRLGADGLLHDNDVDAALQQARETSEDRREASGETE
jgi:hypothetical protein